MRRISALRSGALCAGIAVLGGRSLSGVASAEPPVGISFPAGDGARSVAVGDFNQDGRQDLAVANYRSDTVSVLLGRVRGGFGAPTSYPAGSGPASVAVGDFNGDGHPDLATANYLAGSVSVLVGRAAGGFSPATNVAAGPAAVAVAVADSTWTVMPTSQ